MGNKSSTRDNQQLTTGTYDQETDEEINLVSDDEIPVNTGRLEFLRDLIAERQVNLLLLIHLMLDLADELDEQQRQLDIAQTAFASVAVAGGIVTVVGFGLAFVTFGASLIVSLVGGGIMIVSGTGSLASTIAENVVAKQKWNRINEELETQHQLETRIYEILKEGKGGVGLGFRIFGVASDGVKLADVVGDVGGAIGGATNAGKAAYRAANAGVPLAKSIATTFGKLLHYGGFVFTVGGMAFDIYTIVDRSIKIHNKKPSKAADEIRKLAFRLKGKHGQQPSFSERRRLDLELRKSTCVLY